MTDNNVTQKELEDLGAYYSTHMALSKILRHRIIRTSEGGLRWEKTVKETPDLNYVHMMYVTDKINLSILLKIYMSIGYSLSGFDDIFTDPVLYDFIRIKIKQKEYYPEFNLTSVDWSVSPEDEKEYGRSYFVNLD